MRYIKRVDYNGTVRNVWDDNKKVCFGVVGTVNDLLALGFLDSCDYDGDSYCFIPNFYLSFKVHFGRTRDEALEELPNI